MINIAICDDDISIAKEIESLILSIENSETYNIKLFENGKDFFASDLQKYNMVFLDIEIGEISGIDIAVELRKINEKALIYFVTNYISYVSEALKYVPFQYLLKPVSANKQLFIEEFNRGIYKLKKDKQSILVKTRYDVVNLDVKNIIYIERINRKLEINMTNEKIRSTNKFDELMDKLLAYGFVQCHHSIIVNLSYIAKIKYNELILKNGDVLPISRNYLQNTRETYNRFLAGVII